MNGQRNPKEGRKLIQAVIVLTLICLGSGLGVGLLYHSQRDDIEANERSVFQSALAQVLGEADEYPTVGEYDASVDAEQKVYMRRMDSGALYAAMGSAQGYQSEVRVLVSVEAESPGRPVGDDPLIHRMAVVSSQETPGLGEQIKSVEQDVSVWGAVAGQRSEPKRPWFQEQFSGKRLSDLVVERTAETDKIAALSGATITSEAATEAARKAVNTIIERTADVYGPGGNGQNG
ncbi:MAG: FMN-binding protein [Candidatus Brocadiia bacterium]